MKVSRHYSLTFVFVFPAIIATILISFSIKNYHSSTLQTIENKYTQVEEELNQTAKVVTALDYSFSNYFKSGIPLLLAHNKQVVNELCQIWPIDALLLAEGKAAEMPSVDIDYMIVGNESLCDEESALYHSASDKVAFAPILSFLFDLSEFHQGVYFIDKDGYVMSSPERFAKNLTKELLSTVKSRPYWQKTANNPDMLTLTGPSYRVDALIRGIAMTIPVFHEEEHQGMLAVNLDADKLLDTTSGNLAGRINIIDLSLFTIPDNAALARAIVLEGVASNHTIYYEFDYSGELFNYLSAERYSLVAALVIYLFMITILFYLNSNIERGYFQELAAKDPMTGLLNRRGLESFWRTVEHDDHFAVAVFDIDDFKKVNDTFGHDKGDEVICFMSRQIKNSIRSSDAAARFGGEEFVVYLRGSDEDALRKTLVRVKEAVCQYSHEVLKGGFTISGGSCIVEAKTNQLKFDALFKCADEKLYVAKTTGKNRIEF